MKTSPNTFTPDELEYIHDRLGYYTVATIAKSMNRSIYSVQHAIYLSGGAPLYARDTKGLTVTGAANALGAKPSAIVRWIEHGAMPTITVPKPFRIRWRPNPDFHLVDTDELPNWLHRGNCLRAMDPSPGSIYYDLIMSRRTYIKDHWIPTSVLKFLPVQMQTINEWTRDKSYSIPAPVFQLMTNFYNRDAFATWTKHHFGNQYKLMVLNAQW